MAACFLAFTGKNPDIVINTEKFCQGRFFRFEEGADCPFAKRMAKGG
jgi:hypothetical protein